MTSLEISPWGPPERAANILLEFFETRGCKGAFFYDSFEEAIEALCKIILTWQSSLRLTKILLVWFLITGIWFKSLTHLFIRRPTW